MTKEYMERWAQCLQQPNNASQQDNVMDKPLKVATWNANGLAKHTQEIKTFIFKQNIDMLLVSETLYK